MTVLNHNRATTNVLGTAIDAVDMQAALERIRQALASGNKNYICVTGVHGVMEARRNPALAAAYEHSLMNVPDGMPLVWVGHAYGHRTMERVAGPDLMLEVFRGDKLRDATHFLLGGAEGVVEELQQRLHATFPHAKIVGTFMPPFRPMTKAEKQSLRKLVAQCKPSIIWVGISCPKQEMLMREMLPLLETRLMFGVGAAFDYHTGRIQDCAPWIKKAGLQWLHRLSQDPRHLWRRYLRNNPAFIFQIMLQLLGLKRYMNSPVTPKQKAQAAVRSSVLGSKGELPTTKHCDDIRLTSI